MNANVRKLLQRANKVFFGVCFVKTDDRHCSLAINPVNNDKFQYCIELNFTSNPIQIVQIFDDYTVISDDLNEAVQKLHEWLDAVIEQRLDCENYFDRD